MLADVRNAKHLARVQRFGRELSGVLHLILNFFWSLSLLTYRSPNCRLAYSTVATAPTASDESRVVELLNDDSTTNRGRDADNELTKAEEQEIKVMKEAIEHGKNHEKKSLQKQQAYLNEEYELRNWFRSVYFYPSAPLESLSIRVMTIGMNIRFIITFRPNSI
jgi:hypothetical protein